MESALVATVQITTEGQRRLLLESYIDQITQMLDDHRSVLTESTIARLRAKRAELLRELNRKEKKEKKPVDVDQKTMQLEKKNGAKEPKTQLRANDKVEKFHRC
ncbi:unnamed protein product [Caenorhabditis sp. 36 PRJEB53466]|nr:unnamed protein product [Caenorhabditis sp. 36 PRJEB53466]